ncbi:hypothetical protein LWI29_025509 [Acer saccharum]|uniref:Uncharacterized protein n=1 Tax=Acer saccharum TaxID=4024 RepID=A0AA39T6B0_ACESA|nr:hypothetical protein LWI29_025509 [Acer saccharum]
MGFSVKDWDLKIWDFVSKYFCAGLLACERRRGFGNFSLTTVAVCDGRGLGCRFGREDKGFGCRFNGEYGN